ncbi:alpha/beta fold hydrolase [Limosilactobacillus fermentum]|uniref:alpha/beta fold hydrolase n=1 Tax=Limosilactobacillus fermentum TaxID=1613 RepID=UPI003B9873A9
MITIIQYKTVNVDGLDVFYREAGDPSKPAFVLLHGFPSSSSMFRNLMGQVQNVGVN